MTRHGALGLSALVESFSGMVTFLFSGSSLDLSNGVFNNMYRNGLELF